MKRKENENKALLVTLTKGKSMLDTDFIVTGPKISKKIKKNNETKTKENKKHAHTITTITTSI